MNAFDQAPSEQHAGSQDELESLGLAGKIVAEFDPRLAEVWLAVFESGLDLEQVGDSFGWFLRMAYLKGYEDASSETDPGCLYSNLGLKTPRSSSARQRRGK
ncbi:MAG TPA: hypothetical protein VND22_01540 [Actinomycetota bacterium]|nr:hypothetical protein [Actinomycetota bacterium]